MLRAYKNTPTTQTLCLIRSVYQKRVEKTEQTFYPKGRLYQATKTAIPRKSKV